MDTSRYRIEQVNLVNYGYFLDHGLAELCPERPAEELVTQIASQGGERPATDLYVATTRDTGRVVGKVVSRALGPSNDVIRQALGLEPFDPEASNVVIPQITDGNVLEEHRREGIARALVETVFDAQREAGYTATRATTLRDNPLGQKLCESLGFSKVELELNENGLPVVDAMNNPLIGSEQAVHFVYSRDL